jgi:hypothetical protein
MCIRYIIKHGSELSKNRLTQRVAERFIYVSRGLSVFGNRHIFGGISTSSVGLLDNTNASNVKQKTNALKGN